MCCDPGDVGRSIWGRYRNSRIDGVDRDVFLISICNGVNRREGVSAENFLRDLWNTDWHNGLRHDYDVVATANALHWFDAPRLVELFNDIFRLLRPGGVFLFVEPACAERPSPLDSPNGSRGSRPVTAAKTGNASGRERTKFLATITLNSWAHAIRIRQGRDACFWLDTAIEKRRFRFH
jgi:SAM-dependent methyltransferase